MSHWCARRWLVFVVAGLALTIFAEKRLPLPSRGVPELPVMEPTVVTAAGRRMLLADADDVRVTWDGSRFSSNRARPVPIGVILRQARIVLKSNTHQENLPL